MKKILLLTVVALGFMFVLGGAVNIARPSAELTLISGHSIAAQTVKAAGTDDSKKAVCEGVNPGGDCEKTANDKVYKLLKDIINILSWIVGVIAVIMVIWGGFMIVTAGGDAGKVKNGRNAIIFAIIGLVIVALAQILVRFVMSSFFKSGSDGQTALLIKLFGIGM